MLTQVSSHFYFVLCSDYLCFDYQSNMNTCAVFAFALLGFSFVIADEPIGDQGVMPPTNPDNSNGSAAVDIPAHVNEFVNANPQIASGPVPSVSADGSHETKCECAVFNTEAPTELDVPILTQAPMTVSCDAAGEENCNKLCSALAEAAKGRGPELLCSTLGHSDNLKASVHSRVCAAKNWTYTGLTAPTEICCHDHQVIECKDQVAPPQNQL